MRITADDTALFTGAMFRPFGTAGCGEMFQEEIKVDDSLAPWLRAIYAGL
jgi:hypothetical protein